MKETFAWKIAVTPFNIIASCYFLTRHKWNYRQWNIFHQLSLPLLQFSKKLLWTGATVFGSNIVYTFFIVPSVLTEQLKMCCLLSTMILYSFLCPMYMNCMQCILCNYRNAVKPIVLFSCVIVIVVPLLIFN